MFYSHEILTSRKYGVATVWLVATLGAKSNTKKVTRKAILDVDVRKACDTIIQPEAPMALRLQSNLLYGVSRVYDQQCHYVLIDAQAAHSNIRTVLMSIKNNDLEHSASKARPEQLILLDDPAFLPETALPALNFDLSNLEFSLSGGSQRSSLSMISVPGYSRVNSTPHTTGGIQPPSSSTHRGPYQLPLEDPFTGSQVERPFGSIANNNLFDDEGEYFRDDMIFEFDANGEMRDIDPSERETRVTGRIGRGRLGSETVSIAKANKEYPGGHGFIPVFDADGDIDMANFYNDNMEALANAEPFPMMSGALADRTLEHPEDSSSLLTTPNTLPGAPKSRRAKSRQALRADRVVELRNSELSKWQVEYKDTMAAENRQILQRRANAQAKKKAFWFVYGAGLNDVGYGSGGQMLPSPLKMFSGESLASKIIGKPGTLIASKSKKTKRALDASGEQQETPKRARQDQIENEVGISEFVDDQDMMIIEDGSMGVEIGREAPSALADHPSSVIMPWNVSASLNSFQRGASSSQQARLHGSVDQRLQSASPLVGRGSALPGPLEKFSMLEDKITYGREDDQSGDPEPTLSQVEFEVFGPAAQVDTQTAGDSQWVRDILAQEAGNFFEYVVNTISEKAGDELGISELDTAIAERENVVTFEQLFEPASNSRIVAAQAFYHVLSLATKNRVFVEQDGDMEPFGSIRIGITTT